MSVLILFSLTISSIGVNYSLWLGSVRCVSGNGCLPFIHVWFYIAFFFLTWVIFLDWCSLIWIACVIFRNEQYSGLSNTYADKWMQIKLLILKYMHRPGNGWKFCFEYGGHHQSVTIFGFEVEGTGLPMRETENKAPTVWAEPFPKTFRTYRKQLSSYPFFSSFSNTFPLFPILYRCLSLLLILLLFVSCPLISPFFSSFSYSHSTVWPQNSIVWPQNSTVWP